MKKLNVLSLFNGMSFGRMALEHLDIPVGNYYSSEIDKYTIQASQELYPDTIQIGDVTKWREWDIDWGGIDLVTGGFPCQAWSMAGKQLGDKDERGMLFWTMLDIMKHVKAFNPDADFLIENVKMKKEFEEYITQHTENALGKVHKILINSALVSAQNRNRYYWTSFAVDKPRDICVDPISILESKGVPASSKRVKSQRIVNVKDRFNCVTATYYKGIRADSRPGVLINSDLCGSEFDNLTSNEFRKLTPRECFRLQTVPEHHIDTLLSAGISNTQLYKMCGNGWTMEVISHILKSRYAYQ